MEVNNLIPIKVAKVTSNDTWPLIYIPVEARRKGFEKGTKVLIYFDPKDGSLVIKKITTSENESP